MFIFGQPPFELFVTLEADAELFRARYQRPGEVLRTASELGPPPVEAAIQSNRMSPPGIPMFYASDNIETAIRETAAAPASFAVGTFRPRRNATILDLSGLLEIPSIFEEFSDSLEYDPGRLRIPAKLNVDSGRT